jgi:oxygen-independent coproporphyrinogen-3 oxidase
MQSFNNKHLKKLGRIHSAEESYHAFNLARKSGFTNINIDLMHDLPEQTQVEALSDLTAAINLKPEHISWYQLTIEPNTVFFNSPPTQPNDIISGEIQNKGQTLLKQFGYCQYEVSAYSQDKKQSQHNLNYWQFGDYLAIGAGGHGKITQNHQSIIRYWQTRIPEHYLSKSQDFSSGKKIVSADDIAIEFLMNAFRLTDGFSEALFSLRTGLDISDISGNLKKAENLQLIVWQQEKITPTLLGQQYLNNLLSIFI